MHKNKFRLSESEVFFSDTGTKPDATANKEYIDESVEPDTDPGERSHLIPATDTGTTSPPGTTLHILPPFSLWGDSCPTPTPRYDSVQCQSNATNVQNTRISVNVSDTTRPISTHASSKIKLPIQNQSTNCGLAGKDVRIINHTLQHVDVPRLDNYQVQEIGTVGGVVSTNHGEVISMPNQCTITGKEHATRSLGKMEYFQNKVGNWSKVVGGNQAITTPDGYAKPQRGIVEASHVEVFGAEVSKMGEPRSFQCGPGTSN